MKLVADAKQFVRDCGRALETTVVRIANVPPEKQMLLASQVVGSCDMLCAVLVFLGETAPRQFGSFSASARPRIEHTKRIAKQMRARAFREVFDDAHGVAPDTDEHAQPEQHAQPEHAQQPAHDFQREPTNPGVGIGEQPT